MFKSLFFCILLSMLPVSELRGAIPVGFACDIPLYILYPACVLANLIPVPFIILFIRRVLASLQESRGFVKKAADWITEKGRSKSALVQKYELWGLFLLVAIPLPGTGAWTGALVAGIMGRRMKNSVPAIAAGVAVAGILTVLICLGVIGVSSL